MPLKSFTLRGAELMQEIVSFFTLGAKGLKRMGFVGDNTGALRSDFHFTTLGVGHICRNPQLCGITQREQVSKPTAGFLPW